MLGLKLAVLQISHTVTGLLKIHTTVTQPNPNPNTTLLTPLNPNFDSVRCC